MYIIGEKLSIEKPIEKHVLEKLHIRTNDYKHPLTYLGGADLRVTEIEHPYVKEAFRQDVSGLQEAPAFWKEENIYQLFLHCEAEEEQGYQKKYPRAIFLEDGAAQGCVHAM
ncbi:hypothetical protein GCM10020331_089980 [Ectobacillus funiculus]